MASTSTHRPRYPASLFYVDVPPPSAAAIAARAEYHARQRQLSAVNYPSRSNSVSVTDKGKGKGRAVQSSSSSESEDDGAGREREKSRSSSAVDGDGETGAGPVDSQGDELQPSEGDELDVEQSEDTPPIASTSQHVNVSPTTSSSPRPEESTELNGLGNLTLDVTDANETSNDNVDVMARSLSSSSAPAVLPTRKGRLIRAGNIQAPNNNSEDFEYLEKIPIDSDIAKVLNRNLLEDGTYEYVVKLDDDRKVRVNADLLQTYEDLLDDYEEALKDGSNVDEDGFIRDSSMPTSEANKSKTSRKTNNAEEDEDYDGPSSPAAGNIEEGEEEEDEIDEDESGEEEEDSDLEFLGSSKKYKKKKIPEATRRSERDGARKSVNYAMAIDGEENDSDEEDEEDDDDDHEVTGAQSKSRRRVLKNDENEEDDDDDSPFVTSKRSVSARSGSGTSRQKRNSSDSQIYELDDSTCNEDGESGTGGGRSPKKGLSIEQIHRDDCAGCGASPAAELLPQYLKKKGKKKKKDDEEWSEDNIRALGAWIECATCSCSYHFDCLGKTHTANSLRIVFKKLLVANHSTARDAKPYLNINRNFQIPSCPSCLKPGGTRCMVCKEEDATEDITKAKDDEKEKEKADVSGKGDAMQVDGADPDASTSTVATAAAAPKRSFLRTKKAVMFRCRFCKRPAHYSCIPNGQVTKWQHYHDWACGECSSWSKAIDAVLAWRRTGSESQAINGPALSAVAAGKLPAGSPSRKRVSEKLPDPKDATEEAEYLVKFKEESFRKVVWVPHSWLFSKHPQRLRNFIVKGPSIEIRTENRDHDDGHDDGDALDKFTLAPKPDAISDIPKEWITPDRILEVEYKRSGTSTSQFDFIPSANMKNRISDEDPEDSLDRIGRMFIKWQGLAYESATWETLPKKADPQYPEFLRQYSVFLKFRNVQIPKPTPVMMNMLDQPRLKAGFGELKSQPEFIKNGKLMDFQLEGVSWLYFNWWVKKGCILADEMGLGKTVQIISFLSILFKKENCQPFLVVVPNSTLQNWQREFDKWAPDNLRVVPYYGSQASKKIIEQYEMFTPGQVGDQKLRAHVVLTTYESLQSGQAVFKRVPRWEALVVDEAQRLKGGAKGLLWRSLRNQRIAHPVLLTGTPVNNNLDELFNLLHFIDPDKFDDLEGLHKKYETLTPELVDEVQDLAQPYFLRRTKEAVLNLPPLSEVIVPLGMSVLQKEVYKSVLSKNTDALASIYDSAKAKKAQKMNRGKMKNVLMELRKTLCHPYLVSDALEHEQDLTDSQMHKNLVEASSKLVFLMDLLPKLKARGHRVLLFSQFVIALNMIERFLEGENIRYVRLDGNTAQSERQENIDAFNAPDSKISVFILTTRAGGVGINLATADTVIIHDADWNPFQDLQAISRAHRIGQKKKVMCFKLMVKDSCEEKIVEKGKKKMVLEQLIVDSFENRGMDDEEDENAPNNVESLLLFGAKALFEEKEGSTTGHNITYSSKAIDELIENTEKEDASAEAMAEKKKKSLEANKAFSYARVWERNQAAAEEELEKGEVAAQRGFWVKMFEEEQQRQRDADMAEAMNAGRGHRKRKQAVNYNANNLEFLDDIPTPAKKGKQPAEPIEVDDPAYEGQEEDASGSEYDEPDAAAARQDFRELQGDQPKPKKPKPNPAAIPPSANGQYHNPAGSSNGQTFSAKYDIPRSVTPIDLRTRRNDMIANLALRAQYLGNKQIMRLVERANQAKTGLEQVNLMKEATAELRKLEGFPAPPQGHAANGAVGGVPGPSRAAGVGA